MCSCTLIPAGKGAFSSFHVTLMLIAFPTLLNIPEARSRGLSSLPDLNSSKVLSFPLFDFPFPV